MAVTITDSEYVGDADTGASSGGPVDMCYFGGFLYAVREEFVLSGNDDQRIAKYGLTGGLIEEWTIVSTDTGRLRSITTDGTSIFVMLNETSSDIVYEFDPASETVVDTFNLGDVGASNFLAIGWNPETSKFWTVNGTSTDIVEYSTSWVVGSTVGTLPTFSSTPTFLSYGSGYMFFSAGGALYAFDPIAATLADGPISYTLPGAYSGGAIDDGIAAELDGFMWTGWSGAFQPLFKHTLSLTSDPNTLVIKKTGFRFPYRKWT